MLKLSWFKRERQGGYDPALGGYRPVEGGDYEGPPHPPQGGSGIVTVRLEPEEPVRKNGAGKRSRRQNGRIRRSAS